MVSYAKNTYDIEAAPWERQKGERDKAWQYFQTYRGMGRKRTLTNVSKIHHVQVSVISQLSSKWGWVERCRAYDVFMDRQEQDAEIEARRAAGKRHAEIAIQMQEKVAARLKFLDPNDLTPANISTWLEVASKLERLSLGMTTDAVEVRKTDVAAEDIRRQLLHNDRALHLIEDLGEELINERPRPPAGSTSVPAGH